MRDCELPRQHCDQLHLRPQLQVEVEQNENADDDPDINEEIDAAADADDLGKVGCMGGSPHEIKSSRRGNRTQEADDRRAAVLDPGIKQRPQQQDCEDVLSDHRSSLRANRSTRIISASLSLWPLASE